MIKVYTELSVSIYRTATELVVAWVLLAGLPSLACARCGQTQVVEYHNLSVCFSLRSFVRGYPASALFSILSLVVRGKGF